MTNPNSTARPYDGHDPERSRARMRRWGIAAITGALLFVSLVVYTYLSNTGQDERIRRNEQKLTEQSQVITKQNEAIGQVCRVAGGEVDKDAQARLYCTRVESGLPAVPALVDTRTCATPSCDQVIPEFVITEQGVRKHCVRDGETDGLPAYRCEVTADRTPAGLPPAAVVADR